MVSQNEMSEAEVEDSEDCTREKESGLGAIEFGVNEM
jgi:hypothetical protein